MKPTPLVKPSGPRRVKQAPTQTAIGEVMADGAARKPSEVARLLGLTPGATSAAMGRMARAGALQKVGVGLYRQDKGGSLHAESAAVLEHQASTHPQPSDMQTERSMVGTPSLERTATPQDGAPHDGSLRDGVARAAFATKLW